MKSSALFAFVLVVAASFAAASGLSAAQTTLTTSGAARPASKRANLWIDVTGGACVRSAKKVAYNNARACSWADANARCRGGDTVLVKGGDYGDVTIRGSNGRTSYCSVATLAREPVTARIVDLGIYQTCQSGPASTSTTNWFKLTGPLKMAEFHADCSDHVYLDKVDVDMTDAVRRTCTGDSGRTYSCTPQPFHVGAGNNPGDIASNFTLRNSKVHDALNAGAMMWLGTPGTNFVLDHNEIYNLINNTNGDIHDECVRLSDMSHCQVHAQPHVGVLRDGRVRDRGASLRRGVREQRVRGADRVGRQLGERDLLRPASRHRHDPLQHVRFDRSDDPRPVDLPDRRRADRGRQLLRHESAVRRAEHDVCVQHHAERRPELRRAGGTLVQRLDASCRLHEVLRRTAATAARPRSSVATTGCAAAARWSTGETVLCIRLATGAAAKRFRGRAPDVGAYESPY